MEIKEILEKIKYNDKGILPKKALKEAIKKKKEIIPYLLEIISDAGKNIKQIDNEPTYMAHMYAMYLLAQFREPKAYPLIVDFFSHPGKISLDTTGDVVTEDLQRILPAVCCGDISLIKGMIENPKLNEYVRTAGLGSLVTLVAIREKSREEILDYFYTLFTTKLEKKYSYVWADLVASCLDLYPTKEIQEEIKKVYKVGLIDTFVVGRLEDVEEEIRKGEKVALSYLKRDHHHTLITNIIKDIKWWACFTPEFVPERDYPVGDSSQATDCFAPEKKVKIGRNEPCPCGSGKKYKKCCGR